MPRLVDYSELKAFAHLADQCASEVAKYLELGYKPEDIVETFSRFFLDRLKIRLTEEALNLMPRGGHNQPALEREVAVQNFSLEFSSAFMNAVMRRMEQHQINK